MSYNSSELLIPKTALFLPMQDLTYTLKRIPYGATVTREYLLFFQGTTPPSCAVIFIHGHGDNAWTGIGQWGKALADNGFLAVLPSLLGYAGIQDEQADYGGKRTREDLNAVAEHVRRTLAPNSLGLWGISRGAMSASLLAAEQPTLFDAIVLQAGTYDFGSFYETTHPGIRANIEKEIGTIDSASIAERSSLQRFAEVKAPTLILHGQNDSNVSADQARALGEVMSSSGTDYQLEIVEGEHYITRQTQDAFTLPFLKKHLFPLKG